MGAAKSSVTAATAMLAEAEAAQMGTETQRRDLEIAEQAGAAPGGADSPPRKPASRAATATAPAIGRNEIVTMMNPETGKSEEMKWKKAQPLLKKGWKLGT